LSTKITKSINKNISCIFVYILNIKVDLQIFYLDGDLTLKIKIEEEKQRFSFSEVARDGAVQYIYENIKEFLNVHEKIGFFKVLGQKYTETELPENVGIKFLRNNRIGVKLKPLEGGVMRMNTGEYGEKDDEVVVGEQVILFSQIITCFLHLNFHGTA
jgi:hypothetical protein